MGARPIGQTVRLQAEGTDGSAYASIASTFTNDGTLVLDSSSATTGAIPDLETAPGAARRRLALAAPCCRRQRWTVSRSTSTWA